jgi:hypothetical protein
MGAVTRNLKFGAILLMSFQSLSFADMNSEGCARGSKGTAAVKRRLPSYGEEATQKENRQAPSVPKRTKRQKISKTPPAKVSLVAKGEYDNVGLSSSPPPLPMGLGGEGSSK